MFYVKENINDTVEVKVELNDENVFCTCPDCGKEIPLFGSDDAVDSTNVPVLERIPLDPKVAAACDTGSLAQSDVTYLTKTAQILADSFGEKKNQ